MEWSQEEFTEYQYKKSIDAMVASLLGRDELD